MRNFINFFFKTIAFFTAITFFILLLIILFTYLNSQQKSDNGKNFTFKEGDINSENKIAILKLKGPILNEPSHFIEFGLIQSIDTIYVSEVVKDLKQLEREKLKGIIISIDSPGGSVSATYKLYNAIKNFKEKNTVKIFLHTNELLASGGYWAALASDKIYADYGALIGSIGVRGPDWIYYDKPLSLSSGFFGPEIATKDGIKKYNTIAGRSKDLFDPFRMPTKEEVESLQSIVNGIYNEFVNTVASNRNIENDFIIEEIGAFLFDAKKAKDNYLIDEVIDIKGAKDQIIDELNLKDFKIINKNKTTIGFFNKFMQSAMLLKYNINNLQKEEVCNAIHNYINVMYFDKESYYNNC